MLGYLAIIGLALLTMFVIGAIVPFWMMWVEYIAKKVGIED